MKTIITILFSFFILISVSQTYDLNEYPLNSKVWKSSYVFTDSVKVTNFTPIDGGSFGLNTSYVKKNIDSSKIQKYLLESFNQFRKDYNITPVTEDKKMTEQCIEYIKILNGKMVHFLGLPSSQSECLGSVPFMMLSKVTEKDGDINKIIADCCFDIFIGCPAHTAALLDPKCDTYGFGVNVRTGSVDIVVRGRLKIKGN